MLLVIGGASCDPSRDASPDSRAADPVETVVVNLAPPTDDIEPDTESVPGSDDESVAEQDRPEDTAPYTSSASGASTGASFQVPFGDYFDVDPIGAEPVRGSGCGLHTSIGDEMPDGLWRGFVRSFDGLWVDAATSLEFDLVCVYAGDAAIDAEREWRAEHPGESPTEVLDGLLVNNNDRVRTVPLDPTFIQVDAQWNNSGHCLPPQSLPPSGETQAYRLLDSWLLVAGGEARWVVTSCLPQ